MTTPNEDPVPSAERELFFGIASDRLRRRSRWAGVVLALSFVIPYEHVDGVPQFAWQLLAELPPAAIVAALATSAAGIAILVASIIARAPAKLALVVLCSLSAAWLLERLGADRAAWDVLPLPESLTDRPLTMLLGLSLVGSGINLSHKPHARRIGRGMLIAAAVVIAGFYLWPARGEAPITTIVRVVLAMPLLPDVRFVLGHTLILMVALFPASMAVLGAIVAISPPSREPRLVSRLATFGLPALLGFFVFRSLLLSFGDSSLPATIGGVALLAALLGSLSAAIEVLGELRALGGREPGSDRPAIGWRMVMASSAGALLCLSAIQWWLARPPEKGVDWKLAAPVPAADATFGNALEDWSRQRLLWDDRVRDASSASELVELKAAERELRQRAKPLDPGVQQALSALISESQDLDLAGRRWFRLVADVNEASRAIGLPYYVDPSVRFFQTPDGLRRRFAVHGYRIERVREVGVDGARYATLHVRRLGSVKSGHGVLGFSRDVQPFALVVLDEIEPVRDELMKMSTRSQPSCSSTESELAELLPGLTGSDDATFGALELDPAMLACGRAVAEVVTRNPDALLPALIAHTERHELQHQIDGPHLPLSSALLDRMAGYSDAARELVNRELSAYIAELTAEAAPPKLGLIALLRFTRSHPRSAMHHVALLALEALVDRDLDGPLGAAAPDEIARAASELSSLSDADLRRRAADAWERLYDAELPEITD